MKSSTLSVDRVSLSLGAFALRDVSLSVAGGEILVLLGANGAGKSVILETIAGFHAPIQGRIVIGGHDVSKLPPEERRVAVVFQNFALFPHLTVAQNVRFAQTCRSVSGAAEAQDRGRTVEALLDRFGLTHLRNRHPGELSGGEKQRVALARALAMNPLAFLLDEPLSALDAHTRNALREELAKFLRGTGVPSVYVTHDYAEAVALADRVAIIENGAVLQSGIADDVFGSPQSAGVARLVGVENLIDCELHMASDGSIAIVIAGIPLCLPLEEGRPVIGNHALVCIRAEDVLLTPRTQPQPQPVPGICLNGRVARVTSLGPYFRVNCDCGFPIAAYVSKHQRLHMNLAVGDEITATIPLGAMKLLEP